MCFDRTKQLKPSIACGQLRRSQLYDYFSLTYFACVYQFRHTIICTSFRAVNIMNRHVVTVNCHMILWKSTSIDTLWTYMGFYHTLSIYYCLLYIGRSHNDLKFPIVVRSLIQDCGNSRIRTLFSGFSVQRIDQLC